MPTVSRRTLLLAASAFVFVFVALSLMAALALTGCSLLKVAVATGDPLSKEQMNVRTMTRGFYYDMAGEVAEHQAPGAV